MSRYLRSGPARSSDSVPCPVAHCRSDVFPNARGDYICHLGRHGRIARTVRGRVMLTATVQLTPYPRVRPARDPCLMLDCDNPRRGICGRQMCQSHCILHVGDCGCRAHNRARELRALAVEQQNFEARLTPAVPARSVRSSAPAGAPLLDAPAPQRVLDWEQDDVPGRAGPAPAYAWIHIMFTDERIETRVRVPAAGWSFDLQSLTEDAKDELHWDHIAPDTLECRCADDREWVGCQGRRVAIVPSDVYDDGDIFLQAQTADDVSKFPLVCYLDTVEALQGFDRLTASEVAMSATDAYNTLFDLAPTDADLEALRVCRDILRASPRAIRDEFKEYGRRPEGAWLHFVRTCEAVAKASGTTAPSFVELFRSPLVHRRRRTRGVPHDPTVGPAPGTPAWQGPPAAAAGPSRHRAQA